ncbi:hypothetical protein B0J12DRAFT_705844 [Macrophomina phaseolina]|uniref:Uncharacterized protein n=1 Tax=Macrophomina phaseolina TaxID=35725 RepID=A0ABQ8FQX0_9PEZI|nr:hypothetical protein B0J12DRAFT_705844 [Macrophomina phaseolina]
MAYQLRPRKTVKGLPSTKDRALKRHQERIKKGTLNDGRLPNQRRKLGLAPDGARRKPPTLEKIGEEERMDEGGGASKKEQESILGYLKEFLLDTFIAEWSVKDLDSINKWVEESGLINHMPAQSYSFYLHAYSVRKDLEASTIAFKDNKEKHEEYVDELVDEFHFDRFFKTSTFDLEDWSSGDLSWTVSKLLWQRFSGFERNEDHRSFAEARMSNNVKAVPVSQLRYRKEPESIPWDMIAKMENLVGKLPRYRPEDSIAEAIEKAYEKLRDVVEANSLDCGNDDFEIN